MTQHNMARITAIFISVSPVRVDGTRANGPRFWALLGALALGILLWILPERADAASFSVQALANAWAFPNPTGNYQQIFGDYGASAIARQLGGENDSYAAASAALGSLGGSVRAYGASGSDDLGTADLAEGQTTALFRDTIYVSGLALGTPVTLTFDTNLTGFITGAGSWRGSGTSGFAVGALSAGAQQIGDSVNGVQISDSGPVIFQTTVGSLVPLSGQLNVAGAAARTGRPNEASSVNSSFGATALFTVDALTPGVVLTSESGHDYSAQQVVPLPSTLLLVISGLPGIGAAAWYCSRRK